MRYVSLALCCLNALCCFAQQVDTIYSTPYPRGVLTSNLESTLFGYRFSPVDNPNLEIVVSKRETSKINYGSGEIFNNNNYIPSNIIVLSSDVNSGKIYYSGILEFTGVKAKNLFNATKTLPEGIIKYLLVSSDENEFSFQKYRGSFMTKFQGDPYHVYFNLLIKFKEGKIKYEYSDFVAVFEKTNANQNTNPFAGGVNVIVTDHMKTLDQLYGRGARNSDQNKFWIPIRNNISDSMKAMRKQCSLEMAGKNSDW